MNSSIKNIASLILFAVFMALINQKAASQEEAAPRVEIFLTNNTTVGQTVSVRPVGMIFNDLLEYSLKVSSTHDDFPNKPITGIVDFDVPQGEQQYGIVNHIGTFEPLDDPMYTETHIGYGKYRVTINSWGYVDVDFSDADYPSPYSSLGLDRDFWLRLESNGNLYWNGNPDYLITPNSDLLQIWDQTRITTPPKSKIPNKNGFKIPNISEPVPDTIIPLGTHTDKGKLFVNPNVLANVTITSNVTIAAGATLTIASGVTVTINSGVTVYVEGTLSIPANATITGGGTIVKQGSGVIFVTNSVDATAFNSSRKLVRDASGNYHLVFESEGEICYEKLISNGTAISEFRRLSSGNGSNKFPCIAERSGKLYVVWQRSTGANTYDILFRHYNGSSWETIRTITGGVSSSNDPLPVIAICTPSADFFEIMVAYRTGSGLKSKKSTSTNGSSWLGEAIITSNTNARNPSLVYWFDGEYLNLVFHVTWDEGNNVYHQTFNNSNNLWSTAGTPINNGIGGLFHQYSSYAVSGNNNRHIVWQAVDDELGRQKIYHKKNLTNVASVFFSSSFDHFRPSVTGHAGNIATAVCHDNNNGNNIRKRRYNGTSWQGGASGSVIANNSIDASVSIANPLGAIAQAVWRSTGTSPYSLTVGPSGGLNKSTDEDDYVYHRRIVYSFDDSSTLALQVDGVEIIEGKINPRCFFPKLKKTRFSPANWPRLYILKISHCPPMPTASASLCG
jgi:hypothetical protein